MPDAAITRQTLPQPHGNLAGQPLSMLIHEAIARDDDLPGCGRS